MLVEIIFGTSLLILMLVFFVQSMKLPFLIKNGLMGAGFFSENPDHHFDRFDYLLFSRVDFEKKTISPKGAGLKINRLAAVFF